MTETGNVKVLMVLVVICCACNGVLGICNMTHCTDITRCLTPQDGRSCKCAVGYYGDLCDKHANFKVVCGRDHITIRVIEEFFQYYKVPLESLSLTNTSCHVHREVISEVPYYTAHTTKDLYRTCGGKPLENNITHLTYSLTLLSSPKVQGNIIRDPAVKIEYTCSYPYNRTVSLKYPVIPFSSETVVRVDELEATVEMLLYKDQTYAEPFRSAPMVQLRDKVYVEVKVTKPEDFFLLRVNECWATQSPQPSSPEGGPMHTLLLNGCVKDETVTFLTTNSTPTGTNGDSGTIRYSFDMFRFVHDSHDLYLHCTVRLCAIDDSEPCIPECKTIIKREAVRMDSARGLLSYGPIRIEIPEPDTESTKSNLLMTLVLPVAGIWVLGLFLLLIVTMAKAGNRRLARLNPH